MVMGTGMKTVSAWEFFEWVLMIGVAVVGLLGGIAVFGRVRVVWVVVEVVYLYVGRDWVGYGLQQAWNGLVHHMICMGAFAAAQGHL